VTARLAVVLAVLLAAGMLALGIPLALGVARSEAQSVFADRLGDATRFAIEAATTSNATDARSLEAALQRYDEVYGVSVVVVDLDGTVRVASRATPWLPPSAAAPMRALRAGHRLRSARALQPWGNDPMTVGEPIVRNGDLIGAVVLVAPVDDARFRVRRAWVLLAAVGLLAVAAALVLARALASWVLRPVRDLGDVTARIQGGELRARVPAETGPPELRQLAGSFNRMAQRVEEIIENQRQFVANASHQLRNPLGALLLRLQALTDGDRDGDDHDHDERAGHGDGDGRPAAGGASARRAAEALREGRSLAATLDDLLALARADGAPRQAVDLDVAAVVDGRIAVWSVVADRRQVALRRTGRTQAPGRHEPAALAGAVDAVLDNALKFSGAGSTVTVDIASGRDTVVVTVTDEGPGLLAAELPRVTDRFWRSARHPNVPGSGLGMPIASALMQRHDGALGVSVAGTGGLRIELSVRA